MIKNALSVAVLLGCLYLGYVIYTDRKPAAPKDEGAVPPPSAAAAAESNPSPPPAPSSAPVQQTSAATPRAKRLAPPGVYYLTERISITTDSGIRAFRPGERVIAVKKQQKKWMVTDGTSDLEVSPRQLTNDLDFAEQLLQADQAAHPAAAAKPAR